MKKKANKAFNKEDYAEEWCFVCKDGGDMIICDHKDCLKSYHPECANQDLKSKRRFICDQHSCESCGRTSDVHCYGCPRGFCRRCIKSVDFVHVKGKKGFCEHCLKLSLLVEEKKDVDSDGETIDFNNLNTYETLYKEYWEIINETEKLTLDVLISAKARLKSGKNYDSDKYEESDENPCSDYEEKDDMEINEPKKKTKRSKPEPLKTKGKAKENMKSNKEEFMGWGSTRLIQFLTNLGKDTTIVLSQRELEKIIKEYSKEKNLIQKNKIVECDVWLRSIFKRKTIRMNRIYDSLETHLAENQASSDEDEDDEDEDELGFDLEEMDREEEVVLASKRKKKNNGDKLVEKEEEVVVDITCFRFASIVSENIRLVYLRRSLVQKFEKEPETFENKVIGSFVRVKEDANGCFKRNAYQLMQVTGVKKCSVVENEQTFLLQSLEMDICIKSLSDDDFTEEECQDLKNKVKSGVLKKLEVVELEEKARNLHKDIVTHWIPRELALLKHRIDQANEKGWRKELFEYLERRQFLQNPTNQTKLLEKVPTVVPDIEEDKKDNKDSPKSILTHSSSGIFKDNCITSEDSKHEIPASEEYAMAIKLQKFFGPMEKENRSKKPFAVKNPSQLFDSSNEKSTISKEEVEDTKSSEWYVKSLRGEKVGPVSLSVLKNWSQSPVALKSKIFKASQTEDQAKPLTAVLEVAFPKI